MNRKKLSVSMAVALAALLITATALAATAYFGGTVDWNGRLTPYTQQEYLELHPSLTPAPEELIANEQWDEILRDVPAGEYWELRDEHRGRGHFGNDDLAFDTLGEMESLLNMQSLPVPALGDSFVLERGYTFFDRDLPAVGPYSVEETEFGTLYKYRLTDASPTDGMGYYIDLRCAAEAVHINVYAHSASEDCEDSAFTVGPEATVSAPDVPGYDAVCVEYTDALGFHRTLSLQKIEGGRRIRIDLFTDSETVSVDALASLYAS